MSGHCNACENLICICKSLISQLEETTKKQEVIIRELEDSMWKIIDMQCLDGPIIDEAKIRHKKAKKHLNELIVYLEQEESNY